MNVVETSRMLRSIDDAHVRINWGGCASMAVMIAEKLQDMSEVTNLRIVAPCDGCIDAAREELLDYGQHANGANHKKESWYDHGVWFAHVWVEGYVNGEVFAFDSTGLTPVGDMYAKWGAAPSGSFTLDEMRSMAAELTWNDAFDRSQLDSMQDAVDTGFAQLEG